jgi:DNA-binding response OmpR family regulator
MNKLPVLMVEDDMTTGDMLSEVLEDAGYDVTLARDGARAMQLLEEQVFTVVISDIRMPAANGIDVLQAARQSQSQPEVILLTGYGALDTSLEALREGVFDYLLKPCHPEVLLQRVADAAESYTTRRRQESVIKHVMSEFGHLTDSETAEPPVTGEATMQPGEATMQPTESSDDDQFIEIGELRIGEMHHTATFRGEPLHLTPTEHTLLHCMAESPGRVFTYRELVYLMHGYDVMNAEAKVLLKTHVRNIRHKIGSDYLVNIRSTGYKLAAPDHETSGQHEDEDEDEEPTSAASRSYGQTE